MPIHVCTLRSSCAHNTACEHARHTRKQQQQRREQPKQQQRCYRGSYATDGTQAYFHRDLAVALLRCCARCMAPPDNSGLPSVTSPRHNLVVPTGQNRRGQLETSKQMVLQLRQRLASPSPGNARNQNQTDSEKLLPTVRNLVVVPLPESCLARFAPRPSH